MSRTCVITGATKGLGRALALEFIRSGSQVLGFYSRDGTSADSLRTEFSKYDRVSSLVKHDVTIERGDLWDQPLIKDAKDLVLINNACAPFTPKPFHLLNWDDFDTGLQVGLKGSWLCSRALLRPMIRLRRGIIVNVLTTAIEGMPPKGFAAYAAAKYAMKGLTQSLASEYRSKGIRCFSVSPGFMSTPLTAEWDSRLVESIRSQGQVREPTEVAQHIRILIDVESTPGNGEDYTV